MTDVTLPPPDAAGPPPPVVEQRLHWASPLVKAWLLVVALGWFVVKEFLPGGNGLRDLEGLRSLLDVPWWLWMLAVLAPLTFAGSYWGWWTTKFVVDDHELRLENRGAFQESKRVAFTRIQSVDVNQPFAARLLGLAEVRIDVGGTGTPLTLAFLTRARATELRDHLMARTHGVRLDPAQPHAQASAWDDLSADDQILIRLNPGEIILGALLSVELLAMVAAALVPVVIGVWFDQWLIGVGAGVIPLLLGIWGFLSSRVLGQFNYTLAATPAGLRIARGLTTLTSQTVPVQRVQAIQLSQPLLWRLVHRYRVDLTVLGAIEIESAGDVSPDTVLLPIGSPAQVQTALDALWPGLRLSDLTYVRTPERARWLDPLAFAWNGYALGEHVLVARSGWFTQRQFVVPFARLQSTALVQGPLQRRVGVTNVALHTTNPLGGSAIVHADATSARALVLHVMTLARTARMTELLRRHSDSVATTPVETVDSTTSLSVAAQPGPERLDAGPFSSLR